jgi:hypothetical protein
MALVRPSTHSRQQYPNACFWHGADHGDGADALRDAVQDQGTIELIDAFIQQPVTQE